MSTGDIVLIPFPFAELTHIKARPAVIISETADAYKDIIVAAISSVVPAKLSRNEFVLTPNIDNGLRVESIVKVDRIVTTKAEHIIAPLGKLTSTEKERFITLFRALPN